MTPTKKESGVVASSPHNKYLHEQVYTHDTSPHKRLELERVNELMRVYGGCWLFCKQQHDRLMDDAQWYIEHSKQCLQKAEQKELESQNWQLQLADYENLLHLAVNEVINLKNSEVSNG